MVLALWWVRIKRGYGCGTERIDGTDMRIKREADMRIKRGADMHEDKTRSGYEDKTRMGCFFVRIKLKSFSKTCYGT